VEHVASHNGVIQAFLVSVEVKKPGFSTVTTKVEYGSLQSGWNIAVVVDNKSMAVMVQLLNTDAACLLPSYGAYSLGTGNNFATAPSKINGASISLSHHIEDVSRV